MKFCGEVELQNTHIVLFTSPRKVMQVFTPSELLYLESRLVHWFWDTISVAYDNFLIAFNRQSKDFLYKQGIHSLKNFVKLTVEAFETVDDRNTKILYSPIVFQSFPHKCIYHFFQCCSKEFIRLLWGCKISSSNSVGWSGGGGGVLDPQCIKIGYSEPRAAENQEGSTTPAESVWVFFGTVILDSDRLTRF